MLAIRMQRTGRKGHANFRVVVQDSRQTPTSGKVVASIGTYDPHTKIASLEKDKAEFYLTHGAQPSDRVARLLKQEGVKLPKWVELESKREGKLRNPEKLRKNRPAGEPASEPVTEAAPAEDVATNPEAVEEAVVDTAGPAVETTAEVPATDVAELPAAETVAEAPEAKPDEVPKPESDTPVATDEAEKPAE